MSASAVAAVTANPTVLKSSSVDFASDLKQNSRRRAIVLAEKESNVGMVAEGGNSAADREKDSSHSNRGETVLERSREFPAKKGLVNSTVSPRRRKVVAKTEQPRWKTFALFCAKLLWRFIVITGFFQLIWNRFGNSGGAANTSGEVLDFERRVSELEGFLKTSAKMMQVQVETVDKKVEKEIGGLRRELGGKIQEQEHLFRNEFKKLESRTSALDESVGKLWEMGFLSKEDVAKFVSDLSNSRSLDGSDQELSLDQIRAVARQIVMKEIERHAADGLAMVDYALASGGAKVMSHSEPYYSAKFSSWLPVVKSPNRAQKMLEPSFGEPGQCFSLKGSSGFVEIGLRTEIIPEAITLEHVAKSVAYDRSSAPKDFRVFGSLQGPDLSGQVAKVFLLGEYTYDLERSSVQTFKAAASSGVVNTVRLEFTSNHGSESHTCIYRIRVHGFEPNSVVPLAVQP